MRIFEHIEDAFLQKEFCDVLSRFLPIQYVNGIPTLHGKSFFWSEHKYEGLKKQYLVGARSYEATKPRSFFFVKYPSSYEQTYKTYDESFRNHVVRAQKKGLSCFIEKSPKEIDVMKAYELYDKRMELFGSLSVSYEFFQQLCLLSYSTLFFVKKDGNTVAFTLMLGNVLFFIASNNFGNKLYANNFLYDSLYQYFENEKIFLGLASAPGLFAFKKKSGAIPVPSYATQIDWIMKLSNFPRIRKWLGYFVRKLPKKFTLSYILPY